MPWFKMQCGEWKSSARTFKKLVLSQLKSENHHNEEKAWWWWQSCVITYFGCMCCCISDDACMALLSVPRLGVVVVQLLVGLWFLWCRMRSRRLSSSHQTDNRPRQSRPGKHHQYVVSQSTTTLVYLLCLCYRKAPPRDRMNQGNESRNHIFRRIGEWT